MRSLITAPFDGAILGISEGALVVLGPSEGWLEGATLVEGDKEGDDEGS